MKIQCKTCQKLHVNGEWTDECAEQRSNIYTYCPDCFDALMHTPLDTLSDLQIA